MRECVLMTLLGFASGMVMYSYFIPLLFCHVDVRRGSADGNPGASNAIRAVGVALGVTCMVLDVGKAFLPVFVAVHVLRLRGLFLLPVLVAPVAGHAFSPLMRFHGGKAVSTTYGSLLGLIPVTYFVFVVAVTMAVFRFVLVVRPDSAGVVAGMVGASVLAVFFTPSLWLKGAMVCMGLIVGYRELRRPDAGPVSLGVGHYRIQMQDNRLVVVKCQS